MRKLSQFPTLDLFVQVSISWSSSDLVPGVAQGLPARLQRLGTRGQTHTAVSVSPRAGKQRWRNRLIRTFLKEGCATALSSLAFCPSALLSGFCLLNFCTLGPAVVLHIAPFCDCHICPSAFK